MIYKKKFVVFVQVRLEASLVNKRDLEKGHSPPPPLPDPLVQCGIIRVGVGFYMNPLWELFFFVSFTTNAFQLFANNMYIL